MQDWLVAKTRHRLIQATLELLHSRSTTELDASGGDLLTAALQASGCDAERVRAFFQDDAQLILGVYARFALEFEEVVGELPAGTLVERFLFAMRRKFEILADYRSSLLQLRNVALDPQSQVGVLNPQTEMIRARVQGIFAAVALGADDCSSSSESLIRGLYTLHLGLVYWWCRESGPTTEALLATTRTALPAMIPLMRIGDWAAALNRFSGLILPHAVPRDSEDTEQRSHAILAALFRRRRLQRGDPCEHSPCEQCYGIHEARVKYFVRANEPLHLIIPGFPAKSPSSRKTLGTLPDRAEWIGLTFLQGFIDEVARLHSPGVRITLCSDGHVFSDLVQVTDDNVTKYGDRLAALVDEMELAFQDGHSGIDLFSMQDLYEASDFDKIRSQLLAEYGQTIEQLRDNCKTAPQVGNLVNGIERFLLEEQQGLDPDLSRTQLRKRCRERALQVVQHSDAWGRLLADCFPFAIRLSIHPQPAHSHKIGILLGPCDDVWLTPWHSVALKRGNDWSLIKRADAEKLGAELVHEEGRPSYFALES